MASAMYGIDSVNFAKGKPILAKDLTAMRDELRRPSTIARGTSGGTVREGAMGQLQIAGPLARQAFVGQALGNITARVGSQWGVGQVAQIDVNVSGSETVTSLHWTVWNPSSNTMTDGYGIDNGQRCWVEEDENGVLVVTPLECS